MEFGKKEEPIDGGNNQAENKSAPQPPESNQFGKQFDANFSDHNPYKGGEQQTPIAQPIEQVFEEKKIKPWHWVVLAIIIVGFGVVGWWYYNKQNLQPISPNNNSEINLAEIPPIIPDELLPIEPDANTDSDGDGITDLEEIDLWQTDPNNQDSDGDSYLDGEEVANGYSPTGSGKIVFDPATGLPVVNLEGIPSEVTAPATPTTTPETAYSFATSQDTLDAFALAINNNDVNLYVKTLSPNNPQYNEVVADPQAFLYLTQYFYDFKEISIKIIETTEEEYPDTVTVATQTYLTGELFQDSTNRLEKIVGEWKILQ